MTRRSSMQLVAEAAGVSKAAVSMALRDDPRLAVATRRRIQSVATSLGYRKDPVVANVMARLRAGRGSRTVASFALINCSPNRTLFDLPGHDELRRGIRERADQAGYGVEEFWSDEPGLKPGRLHEILRSRGIQGVILAATPEPAALFPGHPEFLRDFALAGVGFERTEPALPRASTDRFENARAAVVRALAAGRRRPGIVLLDHEDRGLRRCYSSGFLAGVEDARGAVAARLPPLLLAKPDPKAFLKWVKSAEPDVILTDRLEPRAWLAGTRHLVRGRVALIHLEWNPKLRDWAGMDPNNRLVGAAAADLVIDQINRAESGVPEHPRLVLIDGVFVPGPSLVASAS